MVQVVLVAQGVLVIQEDQVGLEVQEVLVVQVVLEV